MSSTATLNRVIARLCMLVACLALAVSMNSLQAAQTVQAPKSSPDALPFDDLFGGQAYSYGGFVFVTLRRYDLNAVRGDTQVEGMPQSRFVCFVQDGAVYLFGRLVLKKQEVQSVRAELLRRQIAVLSETRILERSGNPIVFLEMLGSGSEAELAGGLAAAVTKTSIEIHRLGSGVPSSELDEQLVGEISSLVGLEASAHAKAADFHANIPDSVRVDRHVTLPAGAWDATYISLRNLDGTATCFAEVTFKVVRLKAVERELASGGLEILGRTSGKMQGRFQLLSLLVWGTGDAKRMSAALGRIVKLSK